MKRKTKESIDYNKIFKPDLSPKQMLALGVFGGMYMKWSKEYPKEWFVGAKLSEDAKPHKELNYFKINASQSLKIWQEKGWIRAQDPHGWFEWYSRYYMGRRSEDDVRQIKRWAAMRRHIVQIKNNCRAEDEHCRPRQRQALLHWAYDSRKF